MGKEDLIKAITDWFKQAMPVPDARNQTVQLGVHFEELGEMFAPLVPALFTINVKADLHLTTAQESLNRLSEDMKVGCFELREMSKADRIELLDALCDQIVTAVGVAHVLGMDLPQALNEVNESNWSKFDDEYKTIFDSKGKIVKGPNYRKPVLDPFV